jgi:hypothetical protein
MSYRIYAKQGKFLHAAIWYLATGVLLKQEKNIGTWQKLSVVFTAGGHVEDPGVAA